MTPTGSQQEFAVDFNGIRIQIGMQTQKGYEQNFEFFK